MVWSCDECGTILKLWQIKCPNCKQSGMSLLHGVVIAAVLLGVAVVLFKMLA
jgi:hypothetical protein